MLVNLITFTKKGGRKDFGVGPNAVVIGRQPQADIRIPVGEVSRAHCEVKVQGSHVLVRDLGSSNGTFVNDQRVSEATLKAGDHVRIGPVDFTVQIDGVPSRIQQTTPKPAQSTPAPANGPTRIAKPATSPSAAAEPDVDFDIDNLEELNSEDLSDMDLGELDSEISDSGLIDEVDEVEEVDEIEEISEDDLIPDDSDEL